MNNQLKLAQGWSVAEIQITYNNPNLPNDRVKISESFLAYQIFLENWDINTIEIQENFAVLYLNRANEVIGFRTISIGDIKSTLVDFRMLVALALKSLACGVIVAHNHPSGNIKPSKSDLQLTSKLREMLNVFDIDLIDHLIITQNDYYSITDNL